VIAKNYEWYEINVKAAVLLGFFKIAQILLCFEREL
jgi:hypothetical protein